MDADVHDEPAGVGVGVAGREVLAARQVDHKRLADLSRREAVGHLAEAGVVAAVIGDPREELGMLRSVL